MSYRYNYFQQKDMCNNTSVSETDNTKYTDPFISNSNKISRYGNNDFNVNSYEFNNNNLFIQDKSYDNIDKAYEHYVSKILNKRDELIKREEKIISKKEKQLKEEELKNNIRNEKDPTNFNI